MVAWIETLPYFIFLAAEHISMFLKSLLLANYTF